MHHHTHRLQTEINPITPLSPYIMKEIQQRIEQALAQVDYPKTPEGLYEPVEYVLEGGGKRLRPTLLLLAYSLYRDDMERALPAAIGIETYHNHTLLHDDLMDHADMRRGRPTVHKKWDANTAILSGDAMLILAFRHMMRCECRQSQAILETFARTAAEICEGQQYDVNFETRDDVSVAEYLEMIRLKTAVLLAGSVRIGALAADAPETDADALYRFAEKIGLAFQLQDDYLDVYGDPAVFGKKIGGDILCGKKTYLVTAALETADKATGQHLLRLLADHEMQAEEKIQAVTALYDTLDIPRLTLAAIDSFYAQAREALSEISLPQERTQPLWDYATSLLGRKN